MYSLEQVPCLGACALAPAMVLDGNTLGHVTPESLRAIVLELESEARGIDAPEPAEGSGD